MYAGLEMPWMDLHSANVRSQVPFRVNIAMQNARFGTVSNANAKNEDPRVKPTSHFEGLACGCLYVYNRAMKIC